MADTQAILSAVALIIAAVSLILALILLVLLEARWVLRLWVSLYQRWNSSIRQLRDDNAKEEPTSRGGRDGWRSSKHW
jgi:hypothetical protein